MAGLSIANVGKRYGVVEVLRGVSMDVANGEFVVLVGPSGCGKSTLLRMIAGLEDITAGEIAIGGRVVNDVPPTHRDIAMVFQNYALYPHKTVAGNMSFSLQRKRMPKAEIRAKVEAAARVLGLEPLLDRYPRELSGGQRQRVAMGRAIVRDPQVFVFDEPLSNLDAKLRVQMRAEVKELHQRLTTTTVYVTHDQVEAMTMADRIVVMRDGRIEQIGSPLELYDRPANAFVASFIGSPSMNLLPGRMTPAGFRTSDGTILPCESRDAAATLYGIRPEHLRLDPDGVALTVKVLEPTGAETQVIGRLGDEPVSGVFRERLDALPGSTLRVSPEPGQVHLFDASEARIGSWPTDP